MGALRKLLAVVWYVIYLVIPITEFGYGVTYSQKGAKCPNVSIIYPGLIGAGVAEGILLFGIMLVVFFRYTGTGNTVHVRETVTYLNNKPIKTETSSYTYRGVAYLITVVMFLVSGSFFIILHGVFQAQATTQFINSTASTYCDKELYQAAFGLTIASYIVGLLLLIFGVVIYKMKS